MLFLLTPPTPLAPPALTVQAPAPRAVEELQALLKAIPDAFTQGKARDLRPLVAKAQARWEAARPGLAKTIPEPEAVFIGKQLKAMQAMKAREQAVGALGIASTLSRYQPRTAERERLQAERAVLLAWCGADAGQWEPQPRLGEIYKPVLDEARGRNPLGAIGVEEALKRVQEVWGKRQAPAAKKALKALLEASRATA